MICPNCGTDKNSVVDSRDTDEARAIRRRRVCEACQSRFTTYERADEIPLMVKKRDGTMQLFDSSKLVAGLLRACEKRPISLKQLESFAASIQQKAKEKYENGITSKVLGELIMQQLRKLDDVAYVRFASVYKSFNSVEEFAREIESIKDDG